MLVELQVKNLALISEAKLEFGLGLTVLTGETGAGKTALLSALKLLVGERGDATYVRDGATEASAQALFTEAPLAEVEASPAEAPPAEVSPAEAPPADALFTEALPAESPPAEVSPAEAPPAEVEASPAEAPPGLDEHIAVRRLSPDGRSRCYLDDSMVTVKALAKTIGPLVDLYGQHEHQSLLKPAQQLAALDNFAGETLAKALGNYQQAYQAHQAAAQQVAELQSSANSSSVAKEQAAFVLREIAKVDPQPSEYEQLKAQLPVLQNGEGLAKATANAVELLHADGQVLDKLSTAAAELAALNAIDPQLDALARQLNELLIGAEDLAMELRSYRDSVEFDPQALDQTLDRLGLLDGLCKRFGPTMTDVLEAKSSAELLVDNNSDFAERLGVAKSRLQEQSKHRQEAAQQLSKARATGARQFTEHLTQAVQDLAMPGAGFEFAITELAEQNWTLQGSQTYELLYRSAPGAKPRALARIASGGELSRIMLAIKTMLHKSENSMTLVFDEIDAGIGGATATAVAERLQELANSHQVIVVTHLAQIAAKANCQFVVRKELSDQGTRTVISEVVGQKRVEEIARMLSGSADKTALEHAALLLRPDQ